MSESYKITAPIAIFDSGVGGLTIMRAIKKYMPRERVIYFGDTAHLPYGDKSKLTLVKYSLKAIDFFLSKQVKAVLIACSSATANTWEEVITRVKGRALVFNVVDPLVNQIACKTYSKVGVIATRATVNSRFYQNKFYQLNKQLKVFSLATPLLVPIIEEGLAESEITKTVLSHYLTHEKIQHIEALILGCTHYPIIYDQINAFYQGKIKVVDPCFVIACHIKDELLKNNLLNPSIPAAEQDIFYVSDYTKNFEKIARKFFGGQIRLKLLSL